MNNTSAALWSVHRFTMWQRVGLTIFLGLFFILASAFRSANYPVILSQAYNGKAVTVLSNTTVIIRLPSNASTGYSWRVTSPSSPLLRLQRQHYITPTPIPGKPPLVGAPGTMEFTFLAVGMGTTQLRLAYQRPWEKMKPPTPIFVVTIHIMAPPHHVGGGGNPIGVKLPWS